MQVHAYLRASTSTQRESPEVQRELIQRYCAYKNLPEPLWYLDMATSGKVSFTERDAGSALCKALKPGDHVIIAKLDRAFRRLSDCCIMLDEFERRRITLHVTNMEGLGSLDLSSPIGRTVIQILAVFAELERRMISERTSESLRALKRKGMAVGRPAYGKKHETRYRTENGKRIAYRVEVDDPEERAMMKQLWDWRKEGWSLYQIREKLFKVKTKNGTEWNIARIDRCIKAEAKLQYLESLEVKP